MRAAFGGGLLVILALARRRRGTSRLQGSTGILMLAAVCVVTHQVAFFAGVRELGIAVGTILTLGSAPLFAGMASVALARHLPSTRWIATTSLAILGLVLVLRPDQSVVRAPIGVLLALSAGLTFGLYTVLVKELLVRGVRRLDTVAVPFAIGGLVSVPLLVIGLGDGRAQLLLVPSNLLVVAWLAVGATAGAYLLFIAGLGGVPAATAATLALAEPLTATLLGVTVFGERLGRVAVLGALVVAVALLLTARRPGHEHAR